MYYHLARTAEQGLIKSWLTLLSQVSQIENDEPLRHIVLELSQEFFETPDWDAWSMHHVKSNRKSELIGLVRKVIIWANAILPFFLAYARKEQDMQLEKSFSGSSWFFHRKHPTEKRVSWSIVCGLHRIGISN